MSIGAQGTAALYLLHRECGLVLPFASPCISIDLINSLSGSDYFFAFFFLHSLSSLDWIGIIVFPVLTISPKNLYPSVHHPSCQLPCTIQSGILSRIRGSTFGSKIIHSLSHVVHSWIWWIISSCNKVAQSGLTSDKAFQARCGD